MKIKDYINSLRNNRWQDSAIYTMFLLFSFLMPAHPLIIVPTAIVLLITWIIIGNYKNRFLTFRKHHNRNMVLLPTLLWLLTALSILYSKNINHAMLSLETKLSLLLMPFLIGTSGVVSFSDKQKKYILKAFVYGTFFSSFFLVISAVTKSLNGFSSSYWTYFGFSTIFHPTYFSQFIAFSIGIIISDSVNKHWSWQKAFLFLYFTIILVFVNSKAGYVLYILLIIINISYNTLSKRNILFTGISVAVFISALLILPVTLQRVSEAKTTISTVITHKAKPEVYESSTGLRLKIWKSASEVFIGNFFTGVGIGDVNDELYKKYENEHLEYAAFKHFNAHSQYFQTTIATGITGLILLIIMLFLPLIKALKSRNILVISFFTISGVNFLFESMLDAQSGVVFFTYFYVMLMFINNLDKNEENSVA